MARKCRKCGKVSFKSELDAKIALAERRAKDRGEKRYYRCGTVWHLTSEEKRQNAPSSRS